MTFGNPDSFAIAAEVHDIVDGWVLGSFAFFAGGKMVGDWDDVADLKGCARWLREFAAQPVDRREPSLDSLSPAQVVARLVDDLRPSPAQMEGTQHVSAEEILRAAELSRRFQISHLGMSSFDSFDVLLLDSSDGTQRLIWRDARAGGVCEVRVQPEQMRAAALAFAEWIDSRPTRDPTEA